MIEVKPGAELIKFHIRGYRPGFILAVFFLEISCAIICAIFARLFFHDTMGIYVQTAV